MYLKGKKPSSTLLLELGTNDILPGGKKKKGPFYCENSLTNPCQGFQQYRKIPANGDVHSITIFYIKTSPLERTPQITKTVHAFHESYSKLSFHFRRMKTPVSELTASFLSHCTEG